ncbi:MAG: NapC/NirT family cytochrome c [Candidatus Omnitrophota bacterium]
MQDTQGNIPEESRGSVFQNWTSVVGGIMSITWFSMFLVLFVLDVKAKEGNPYLGIITYLVIPLFLTISLLLIPIGAFIERKRRVKGTSYIPHFPKIDFNNPKHQKIAYVTIGVVVIFFIFIIVDTYKAYEFSESVSFCGQTCHGVMSPEYTSYKNSPHARVACVSCHIGPGVDWFVRSKLSGVYQVYAVTFNKYHRPIETPIKNLRPAQETCEQCHWPQKFFGAIEQDKEYYLSDEKNTVWTTRMLMSVGGGMAPYGKGKGIHWHMNINNKVFYAATDKKRQNIPWIKVVHNNGKEETYVDTSSKVTADKPPAGELHRMDCMDCHNRPSHNFKPPFKAVNEAIFFELIDKSLPFIKREAVKALDTEYPSNDVAVSSIREKLEAFYKNKYPQVYEEKKKSLNQSIQAVINIYESNIFPGMKASWKAYPDNIGHLISTGCFRCHDNKHKTAEGKTLSNECTLCHTIIEQGDPGSTEKNTDGLPFRHPQQDEEGWKEGSCVDCHTGGS